MNSELAAILDRYEAAWNAMDFDALAALWNSEEAGLYYVAEEVDRPLYTFGDIKAYWRRTAETIEWLRIETADRRDKLLSDDLATLTFAMHVDASMQGFARQGFRPVGSDVRVSAILRKTKAGWRFIHYVEAPLGALPFLRRVYNANVREPG